MADYRPVLFFFSLFHLVFLTQMTLYGVGFPRFWRWRCMAGIVAGFAFSDLNVGVTSSTWLPPSRMN